jgi:hypothetical protein
MLHSTSRFNMNTNTPRPLLLLLLQSAVDGMTKLLPDLPELRPQLQALLGPQVAALDSIVSQASRQAVDAAAAASQGALLGLDQAMKGITGLLKDAQFQVGVIVLSCYMP